jgi:adenylate cyclase
MALLRQAVELDPNFAVAWIYLGVSLNWMQMYAPRSSEAVSREADEAMKRAALLAPDHWARPIFEAESAWKRGDFHGFERGIAATVERAPEHSDIVMALAGDLWLPGRIGEAVVYAKMARRADPLALSISNIAQQVLDTAGLREEAHAEYLRSRDLAGNHWAVEFWEVLRMWRHEDPARVKEQFVRALPLQFPQEPYYQELLGVFDQPEAALRVLHRAFSDKDVHDHAVRVSILSLWAGLYGDPELALAMLRRGIIELSPNSNFSAFVWRPEFKAARKLPAFKQLLRDLKIVDYWRATGKWGDFARPVGTDDFEVW